MNNNKRAEKIVQRINQLAAISEDNSCLTRTYGTPAFREGAALVLSWMKEAGLQTRIDNIGNVRGRLESTNPDAKTLVIASHIDTVVNAGKFDGPLGVIMGIDLVENLHASNGSNSPFRGLGGMPFHIEVIGFSDEEGCRFHTTYLGSKVVAGSFDEKLLNKKDVSGITLREAAAAMNGDVDRLKKDAITEEEWLGYFEIHIEQGPVLWEKDIPVALVTAIAGQKRIEITFTGVAGHAGTVPMDMRKDALCAAADFIVAVEDFGNEHKNNIVATVGKLNISHSASNVIPGKVVISLDLRSANETILTSAHDSLKDICESICVRRSIDFNWNIVQHTKPVTCSESMNELLSKSINNAGYELVKLVSGAGHDGVPISAVSPVSMLFVRCFEGISHNPLENVEAKDIAAAVQVSDSFIQNMIASIKIKEENFAKA